MDHSLTFPSQQFASPRLPRWSLLFAGVLIACAFMQAVLLTTITDPHSPYAERIILLQPVAAIGAALLTFVAAWRHTGGRRIAWLLHGLGMLCAVIALMIEANARVRGAPIITPLSSSLYVGNYAFAVFGSACYWPWQSWRIGSATRMITDALVVGVAVAIMGAVLLQEYHPFLPSTTFNIAAMLYPALDASILFVFSALALRYGRRGGPLLLMACVCISFLLVADIIFGYIVTRLHAPEWAFVCGPLLILHRTTLALGAYWSVTQPPTSPPTRIRMMPPGEWIFWSIVPRQSFLFAIALLLASLGLPVWIIVGVFGLMFVRDALAGYEYWRSLHDVHEAHNSAQHAEQRLAHVAASIAHDTSTPMSTLATVALHLRGQPDAKLLQTAMHHLQELFDDQLAFVAARAAPLSVVLLDAHTICAATVAAHYHQAEEQQIMLAYIADAPNAMVIADATALRRILDNLVNNALAVTPRGGQITLRTSACPDPRQLEVAVIDTGPGVPPYLRNTIFQPYVRLRGDGRGLGLAIVRDLVVQMGGSYGVTEGLAGKGSTFWIHLPSQYTEAHNEPQPEKV